jgi:4-amino-4-deoxy-L-arabinose transferase
MTNTNSSAINWSLLYTLIAVYLVIYILPLNLRPLIIPDEARYAEIPREMIKSGDWLVPHLNGLRYFEKPPMGYWLNALSISLFGENGFAVRLSSALAVGFSTLLGAFLLIRSGQRFQIVVIASVVYLTISEVLFVGTYAVLDTVFAMFLSGGLVFYYLAATCTSSPRWEKIFYWQLCGVFLGCAFLTKGFLAFAIPGIILFPWILWEKRYDLIFKSLWVVPGCLLTILPWALLIHFEEPDFWRYFFYEEHIKRYLSDNAQHKEPYYYYLAYFPLLVFPWFACIPAAISGWKKFEFPSPLSRFLLLWLLVPILFFSISKGKLATYILPCFIPFAIFIGIGVSNYINSGASKLFNFAVVANAILFLVLAVLIIYFTISGNYLFLAYIDVDRGKFFLFLFLISISIVFTLAPIFMSREFLKIACYAMSVFPLMIAFNLALPTNSIQNKSPIEFFEKIAGKVNSDVTLVVDGNIVRAASWSFKREDLYMLSPRELGDGLG